MTDSEFRSSAVDEVASILAAGLQRLLARKSSRISGRVNDSPLDCRHEPAGDVERNLSDIAP